MHKDGDKNLSMFKLLINMKSIMKFKSHNLEDLHIPKNFQICIFLLISVLVFHVNNDGEPSSFEEARESENVDKWRKTMDKEMKALQKSETWEHVDLPPRR